MTRTAKEQEFQDLLEGRSSSASPQLDALAKIASALGAESARVRPSAQFRARLRNELLARASATPEDAFAAFLDGIQIDVPEEVKPLVAVASALEPSALPAPDPAFRFRLRNELLAQGAAMTAPRGIRARVAALNDRMRKSFRVVGATAVVSVVLAGSGSALAASAGALPGDALYGVKRFHESAQLLVLSGESEGDRLLDFARTRYEELRGLTERGVSDQSVYVDTLADMNRLTTDGTRILLAVFKETKHTSTLEDVKSFALLQSQDLSALIPLLPPGARPAARDALHHVERVLTQVEVVLEGCGACPDDPAFNPAGAAETNDTFTASGCVCQQQPSGADSGGGSPTPSDSNNGGNGGGAGNGGGGANQPPSTPPDENEIDAPDELPDEVEQPVEELIDDLLDSLDDQLPPPPSDPPLPPL
ncbi:MAG TPA: DUF5667 domain-containing protein [Actinomycetota bacterium]